MKWETVIGLETHAQLSTRSKVFSGAATAFGAAPNTQACAVDIALPGVLPVLNRGAVERAIRFGLAVGAKINRRSIFARKNYFYPDLPKGYQISQYEIPIVEGGTVTILSDGKDKTVRLTRAHLEEDAGKSLHEDFHGASGIDLNRAGTPLLEIVSEPDMRSAREAVVYAKALHALVRWIDICDGSMQEGSFRCDANVSVRPHGTDKLGTRCEIKNLNSFRFLERAIEFEARRQIEILADGGTIVQETRLYDSEKDETRSMRTKEDAHDYRYFPDPDLLPLVVTPDLLKSIESAMPELPQAVRRRFERDYGLSTHDAILLTASKEQAGYYEAVAKRADPKLAANWVMGEVSAALNAANLSFEQCPVSPTNLAKLITRVLDGTINNKAAKVVFDVMWENLPKIVADKLTVTLPGVQGRFVFEPDEIIKSRGLEQISDAGVIETLIDEVLAANAKSVEEFRAGKEKAFNALVGRVMKATEGKANPQQVNEILARKLSV